MAYATAAEMTSYTNYETLLNTPTTLQPKRLYCMKKAKNIAKKKLFQAHIMLKLRKNVMSQFSNIPVSKKVLPSLPSPVVIPVAPLATPYPYQLELSCPQVVKDWQAMHTRLFPIQPLPVIIPARPSTFATAIYPFSGTVVHPILTPIIPQAYVHGNSYTVDDDCNYINKYNFSSQPIDGATVHDVSYTYYMQEETTSRVEEINCLCDGTNETINISNIEAQSDPLDAYLTLPKELFPPARKLKLDPNVIIDEFCKMPNLQRHAPWLLDLEFGIPRTVITRPLPIYNVKFNSIHCKNAPDAIHPTFETCTPDFKRALLFYYDCVVSAWYRGYIMISSDRSVENFQTWLLIPMQVLGMCWP